MEMVQEEIKKNEKREKTKEIIKIPFYFNLLYPIFLYFNFYIIS
ncbi:hypothetical protein MetfoDRAFT_1058 [Methanotorris formicicus Mc-S-70]|uniref:Uncharacterized protein n=1 Tax=Methanotorris formicicus Mc-S-70 TaxID=647171 RepID=H1KZ35_9EURY|nr:hypothetical protein MetfoDRAFT_1058 [Methanotorris formicicus Mc-S-70]